MRSVPSGLVRPTITIRVAGELFEGHLVYLNQLIQSAVDCDLWVMLDLAQLVEVDGTALRFLLDGEGPDFGIASCPDFIRERMEDEKARIAA